MGNLEICGHSSLSTVPAFGNPLVSIISSDPFCFPSNVAGTRRSGGRVGARWHLTGDSCGLMPFRALNLSPQIMQAVRDAGYTEPTPIQVAAIPLISAGHDIIGIAQTGTGKTAAFVLPILMKLAASKPKGQWRAPRALVVAPTRELVVQIEENVRAYAKHVPLRMATVFGGVSERPQIEALRSGVDLVVATPGRLIDLMDQRVAKIGRASW